MHVRIVETGNHRPAAKINDLGLCAAKTHDFVIGTGGKKPSVLNRHGLSQRSGSVERRNARIS